jgi:hypothetical protein
MNERNTIDEIQNLLMSPVKADSEDWQQRECECGFTISTMNTLN